MLDLLLFSFCCSLACTAIHVSVTWEGMVLNWTVPHLDYFFRWLRKPIYECLICMSSFWTVFFWCCYIKPIGFEMLFAVLVTCGFNVIIRCIINATTEDDGC